jgi:predicted RNase H-like nuclease (RuvC/YqgF family)
MDTPIHNAEIVSPVETIMVVKAQLKKTMVTMSRLIKENQALRERLVSYDHATGIANEKDIALKAQLEVSLREIRGLKHEASVKCNDVVDANQSHKVRIIEMEKELDILKQANPSFKAFIIPLKKQMTSLRKRLSNIHDKHDKLLKELIEFSVCCTWRNRQWSLERPRGEPFAKIEEILMDFKKEKYMKGLDSKGYNTKV